MEKDLNAPIEVPFSKVYLDPNNPRIAASEPPGYEDAKEIFNPEIQANLAKRMEEVYDVSNLEAAIEAQGWVPIDAILVWEHPKKKGHFIVVEGNTRTVVLRKIRERLEKETAKLARIKGKKKGFSARDITDQEKLVSRLQQIVKDTEILRVFPVNAKTVEELEQKLPRLLGVRHITHARQWSPYAANLYILSLYQKLFTDRHDDAELMLDDELVKEVAALVSLNETKTRRNIQKMPHLRSVISNVSTRTSYLRVANSSMRINISSNRSFRILSQDNSSNSVKLIFQLSPEMEDVLFKWAFAKPRSDEDDNSNKFHKAESIRAWNAMKKYDDKHSTSFSSQFDIEDPDSAPSIRKLEAEFLAHKAQISPVDTVEALLESFGKLKADTLKSQSSHLRPMLEELQQKVDDYLKMIEAVAA